jgi:hypothetical protein
MVAHGLVYTRIWIIVLQIARGRIKHTYDPACRWIARGGVNFKTRGYIGVAYDLHSILWRVCWV